ncbi:GWT1-domain-containing protein [Dipodascopsis tothii]|uniref:GWT1-domain-containing protein n=1 Tax=Dipodascopsis tothii TaxID=44089 RepID=UPI0034D00AF0
MSLNAYLPKKPFLTAYRGGMMIITCIAILAVDFEIFPRRFAKVETWGTSLMDLGVGSFVFSMGLVSARGPLKSIFYKRQTTFVRAFATSVRQSLSVLLLGLLRLALVKAVDYHEHISEYGVHWNFFMTLGLLPPFVSALSFGSHYLSPSLQSLLIGLVYEALLQLTGLTKYILTAPRTNIVAMNKEGIFSFIGYLSIFLAGQATGFYTLPSLVTRPIKLRFVAKFIGGAPSLTSHNLNQHTARRSTLAYLGLASVANVALYQLCTRVFNLTVSRRLANWPYVLWVVAYNNIFILMYLFVEMVFFPVLAAGPRPAEHLLTADDLEYRYDDAVPWGLEAVNDNGLAIFLFANMLTGLVNLSVNTLEVKNFQALTILIQYSAALAVLAAIMKYKNWRLRL